MERRDYTENEQEEKIMERRIRRLKARNYELKKECRTAYVVLVIMTIIVVALIIQNGFLTRRNFKQENTIWDLDQQLSDEQFQHKIDQFDSAMLIRCLMDAMTEAANTDFTETELRMINNSYEHFLAKPNERTNVTMHYGYITSYAHEHGVDFPYADK